MGFTGLALGAMLLATGSPTTAAGWTPPDGQPHFAQGQERDLDLPGRRHEPHGELRSQAGAQQVRRQDDRRDAAQVGAGHQVPRRERPDGRVPINGRFAQAVSAAGRLQEARPERHRDQRLVAAPRRLRRRPGHRPLDVDHRQQPRRPAAVPHRPPRARRAVSHDRLVGSLRPGLAQRQPAAVRRAGHAVADCCGGIGAHGGQLPRPRAQRRAAGGRSHEPAPLRAGPPTDVYREEQASRVRPAAAGSTGWRRSSIRTIPALGPHQVVRAGLPHAAAVPDVVDFEHETRRDPQALRPRQRDDRRPSAKQCLVARRLVERACGSCRSFTAATAAPAPGTPTAA